MNNIAAKLLRVVMPRRAWYRRVYLRTEHWRKVSAEARARANHRCERCGARGSYKALDVHHVSYAHLWREYPVDLQVLCRACHTKIHKRRER